METFLQDLRHSLRLFRQSPGFTAAAVAALTLGIGTNCAIFSVVNTVLLKPAPFPDPDRLVMFENVYPQGADSGASPTKFEQWREQTSVVQEVSAFRSSAANVSGTDFPEQVQQMQVSADFFHLFGAAPIRGRTFTPQEDAPHGPKVAVISSGFWNRRFAADPGIVGKTIALGGDTFAIVGVLSPSFDFRDFGPQPDVWVPFQLDPNSNDQGHYFQAAGRLKNGVTLAQANARMKIAAGDFKRKWAILGPNSKQSFDVKPIRETLIGNVRPTLLVLAGAVSFVLLIACANVANLLLARAVARRREIAIRAAIGAGRGRIVRQLLTESVLLSLTGAVCGSALGILGIGALLRINTAGLPRVGKDGALVVADWRVLAFTIAAAAITGILFGLIPALHSSRPDLSATLKESGGRGGSGMRQNKMRTVLVIGEVALAVILLVGSALLIRTSIALGAVNPGFDSNNVVVMSMSVNGARFQSSAAVDRVLLDGVDRLDAIPGVETAGASCCVPLENGYGLPFRVMGRPLTDGPFHGGAGWITVSPGFFEVFKIPVIRGRSFVRRDDAAAPPVVVINQAMARRYWPKSDPLADQILIGKGVMPQFGAEQPRQIVGIVGDIHGDGLEREPPAIMYIVQAQVPDPVNALNARLTPMKFIVRTRVNPRSISAAIQETLRQVTGLPVTDLRTMDDVVAKSVSRQRFNMLLMTVFGSAALLLAAIGIYGLMAYSVQQRTQEIGIRLALGAATGTVRRMVVLQGMGLALAGMAVGLLASLRLTRVLQSFLFGVKDKDPAVFAGAAAVLAIVSLLAVWIPARRATRIDPVIALRAE